MKMNKKNLLKVLKKIRKLAEDRGEKLSIKPTKIIFLPNQTTKESINAIIFKDK